jgi:hypothetical protein
MNREISKMSSHAGLTNRLYADVETTHRVCVRVWIQKSQVDIVLSTPHCPPLGGGGGSLNLREQEIFDLWKRLRLNDPNFEGNDLWAFLKQVSR